MWHFGGAGLGKFTFGDLIVREDIRKPVHMLRKTYTVIALFALCLSVSAADPSASPQPKRARFRVTNLLTIQVPQDAKNVRIWFAVPQEDADTIVHDFKVTSAVPVRYDTDSWGNRIGYAEVATAEHNQLTIEEDFDLTRSETIT